MITYKEILEDKIVIEEYNKIDKQNKYPFIHGMKHIENTIGIMKALTNVLEIKGNAENNLLIATAFHDIGQVDGREEHGLKGSVFATKYLKGKIKDEYLESIAEAIHFHDAKENLDELPLFTNLVALADKLDFTNKRLEPNYKEKFGYLIYEDITNIYFVKNKKDFIVNIYSNEVPSVIEQLMEREFFANFIKALKAVSDKLNLGYKIYINNILIK